MPKGAALLFDTPRHAFNSLTFAGSINNPKQLSRQTNTASPHKKRIG
jgi:hypothetical protein